MNTATDPDTRGSSDAVSSVSMSHMSVEEDDKHEIWQNPEGISSVISGFLSYFMVFGIAFSYGVFQEFYTSEKGPLRNSSNSQVALIGTIGSALTYACSIFNKSIMYYLKPRDIMLLGTLMMSLGLICTSFCTEIGQFIGCQGILFGFGSSLLYTPPIVCTPFFFKQHRGMALGVIFSGTGFGGLVIAAVTRALLSRVGWQWCLRILGLASLAICTIASFLVVEPKVANFKTTNGLFNIHQLGSYKVGFQIFSGLLHSAGYLIPLTYMAKYSKALGYSDSQGALFIGINNVVNAVFKIFFGFGADKYGKLNVAIICNIFSFVSIFSLWLIDTRGTFLSFVIVYGVFSGAVTSLLPSTIVELFGVANFQALSGIMYLGRGIGTVLGSPIAGLLIKNRGLYTDDFRNPIIYDGALLVGSTCLMIILRIMVGVGPNKMKLNI